MPLRRRRLTLGVLIIAQILTGCTSWQVVQVSPRALVDSAHVSAIRVQEKGGEQVVLDMPRVAGDSLMGTVRHMTARGEVEDLPRRIPFAAVDHVAIRKPDAFRTVLGILAVPAMLVVVTLVQCAKVNCLD